MQGTQANKLLMRADGSCCPVMKPQIIEQRYALFQRLQVLVHSLTGVVLNESGGASRRAAAPARFRQGPGAALAPGAVAFRIGRKGDDVSPLQEAIEGRGNQARRAAESGGPGIDAEIAGQNGRAVAVALVNDFVENAGEVALGEEGDWQGRFPTSSRISRSGRQ